MSLSVLELRKLHPPCPGIRPHRREVAPLTLTVLTARPWALRRIVGFLTRQIDSLQRVSATQRAGGQLPFLHHRAQRRHRRCRRSYTHTGGGGGAGPSLRLRKKSVPTTLEFVDIAGWCAARPKARRSSISSLAQHPRVRRHRPVVAASRTKRRFTSRGASSRSRTRHHRHRARPSRLSDHRKRIERACATRMATGPRGQSREGHSRHCPRSKKRSTTESRCARRAHGRRAPAHLGHASSDVEEGLFRANVKDAAAGPASSTDKQRRRAAAYAEK